MKSTLGKIIAVLIGLALAFAAGVYGASLLDPTPHENAKEIQEETAKDDSELPEIDFDELENTNENAGEPSSENNDGNMIENPDSSETEGGMIVIDSDDDSDPHSADEYDEDELPEDEIIP